MIKIEMKYPKGDDATSLDDTVAKGAEGMILTLNALIHMGLSTDEAIERVIMSLMDSDAKKEVSTASGFVLMVLVWGKDTGRIEFTV